MAEQAAVMDRPKVVYPLWYEARRLCVKERVRRRVADGERNAVSRLSHSLGVTRQTVSMVIHGKRWSPRVLEMLERELRI